MGQPHDRNFLIKALAIVSALHYPNAKDENIMADFIIESCCDLGDMKCALITNQYNTDILYEVEYNGNEKKFTVVSYLEVGRSIILDDEL